MKLWREKIQFKQSASDVRLVDYGTFDQIMIRRLQEHEQTAFERGRREGESAVSEQLVQLRSEVQQLQLGVIGKLEEVAKRLPREMETVLVELALDAAEKLVGGNSISVEMVRAVIQDALNQVEESSEVRVLCNKDDLALLENQAASQENKDRFRVQLVASPEITRGGCVVQTRFGYFDARREVKLKLLKEAMR